MVATMAGETKSVKLLLKAGADPGSETVNGDPPLQRSRKLQDAGMGDYREIIGALEEAGGQWFSRVC